MNNKQKLIITAGVLAVLVIPTMAWALAGPLAADPQVPNPGDGAVGTESYDWMNQMHDYMWNNGELPEDFPVGPAGSGHPMGSGMWGDR